MAVVFLVHAAQIAGAALQVASNAGRSRNIGVHRWPGRDSGADMAGAACHTAIVRNMVARLCTQRPRPGCCGCVADAAIVRCRDMARVLADRLDAIVTGRARARGGVCKRRREPA